MDCTEVYIKRLRAVLTEALTESKIHAMKLSEQRKSSLSVRLNPWHFLQSVLLFCSHRIIACNHGWPSLRYIFKQPWAVSDVCLSFIFRARKTQNGRWDGSSLLQNTSIIMDMHWIYDERRVWPTSKQNKLSSGKPHMNLFLRSALFSTFLFSPAKIQTKSSRTN